MNDGQTGYLEPPFDLEADCPQDVQSHLLEGLVVEARDTFGLMCGRGHFLARRGGARRVARLALEYDQCAITAGWDRVAQLGDQLVIEWRVPDFDAQQGVFAAAGYGWNQHELVA